MNLFCLTRSGVKEQGLAAFFGNFSFCDVKQKSQTKTHNPIVDFTTYFKHHDRPLARFEIARRRNHLADFIIIILIILFDRVED